MIRLLVYRLTLYSLSIQMPQLADDIDCIQCESCRQDDGYYAHQWEKIERE